MWNDKEQELKDFSAVDLPEEKTAEVRAVRTRGRFPWLSGFANSIFQSSGEICGDSNWTEAAANGTVPFVGNSVQHWEFFESDIQLIAKSGANTYRFSLEWSHIEPAQGYYDSEILERYKSMFAICKKHGLEPMATLFHFNEPLWFTRLGGFEQEANIDFFLKFAETVFQAFSSDVSLWCTINEPAVQAFSGYLYGQFPPHRHNLQMTVDVLTNLLCAHVSVYHRLKQMKGGREAMIGLVHNPIKFIPRYWWEPIELILSKFLTTITNTLVMTFLKTGEIHYRINFLARKDYEDYSAPSAFDFIGLNFYANPVIGFNATNFFGPTCFFGQEMGDMYLPMDPDGFASAIDECAGLGKPVYVTEMGFADRDDELRQKFLRAYLDVIDQKIHSGVDIRGLYYWTFMDNYEWNEGYTKLFGLFDGARQQRKSALIYEEFMQKQREREADVSESERSFGM